MRAKSGGSGVSVAFYPRIFGGFVIAVIAAIAACDEQNSIELAQGETCYSNASLGMCTCNAYGLASLDDSFTEVADCDSAPAGVTWDCQVQLDAHGDATNCACSVSLCWQIDTQDCECAFVSHPNEVGGDETIGDGGQSAGEIVGTCLAPAGHCCQTATTCICGPAACATNDDGGTTQTTEVDSCTPPLPPSTDARNCAGLTWEGN